MQNKPPPIQIKSYLQQVNLLTHLYQVGKLPPGGSGRRAGGFGGGVIENNKISTKSLAAFVGK